MNFADIQEQGFIPLSTRDKLSDTLHKTYGFDTDFKFITNSQMKTTQKKVREENKSENFLSLLFYRSKKHLIVRKLYFDFSISFYRPGRAD